MEVDYTKTIEVLIANAGLSEEEIFDFSGTPGEEEFRNNLNFCQEALELHSDYGIKPSKFYYRNNNTIDARAKKTNGHYLIGISKGLIEFFDRCFITKFNLSELDESNTYSELEKKLPDSIGVLMYQLTIHFTFYHELGHLIQFVEKEEIEFEESLNAELDYTITSHSEELDADLFGSICVSTHLYQYFEKHLITEVDEKMIIQFLSILTTAIFIYFLSFSEYRDGFYLKEKSHPHPLIRIISATERIIDYFGYVLKQKGKEININQKKVLEETFQLAEKFIDIFIGEKEFQGFASLLKENIGVISDYYNELIKIINENPNSAVNRRNQLINQK